MNTGIHLPEVLTVFERISRDHSDQITRLANRQTVEHRQLHDYFTMAREDLHTVEVDYAANVSALAILRREHSQVLLERTPRQREFHELEVRMAALDRRNLLLEGQARLRFTTIHEKHSVMLNSVVERVTRVESQLSQLVRSVSSLVDIMSRPSEGLIQRMTELQDDTIQPAQAPNNATQDNAQTTQEATDNGHATTTSIPAPTSIAQHTTATPLYHFTPTLMQEDFINTADNTTRLPTAVPSIQAPAPQPRGRPPKRTLQAIAGSLPAVKDQDHDDEDEDAAPAKRVRRDAASASNPPRKTRAGKK